MWTTVCLPERDADVDEITPAACPPIAAVGL